MELLDELLNKMKETFIFSRNHKYHNIDLIDASLFNLQIELKNNENIFKDIDLIKILNEWLDDIKNQGIIIDFVYEEMKFFIYFLDKKLKRKKYILYIPEYNNIVA